LRCDGLNLLKENYKSNMYQPSLIVTLKIKKIFGQYDKFFHKQTELTNISKPDSF
jgi:hypothetical protein